MRLAVTIDTEADGQWDYGVPVTVRNAGFWQPFQELSERHGVAPTYLVASEIAEDDQARELLQSWRAGGRAEIGAHLHPWTTPPFRDRPGLRYNDAVHAFPSQLPDDLLADKTHVLTEQVAAAFGERPRSFRAGRFGLDERVAACLAAEGYAVDSSVTPLCSWRGHPGLGGEGGPDFRRLGPHPFVFNTRHGMLLELPVTVLATYAPLRRSRLLLEVYRSLPLRALRKLLLARWLAPQPLWLNPDPRYTWRHLAAVWEGAEQAGVQAAVMMFHSSELMPGGSPFRPDAESVRELLSCLDDFFAFVRGHGGTFATLTGLAGEIAHRGVREGAL